MKLMVTGGAGFIGSAVIRHIIRTTDWQVANVDKLTYAGNLESLADAGAGNRHRHYKTDICDRTAIDAVLAETRPDAVLHLAAESHVDRSITGAAPFIETNVTGTYTLLEAALAYTADPKLDALIAPAVSFHDLPARLPQILAPSSGILCQRIDYP